MFSEELIELIQQAKANGFTVVGIADSNIYKVEMHIEDHDFLDWDSKITEKQASIIEGLPEWAREELDEHINWEPYTDLTGREFYLFLMRTASEGGYAMQDESDNIPKAVSEALHTEGIKGVRYLAGSSRRAGKGASNYVIFNDDDISITHENGEPIQKTSILASPKEVRGSEKQEQIRKRTNTDMVDRRSITERTNDYFKNRTSNLKSTFIQGSIDNFNAVSDATDNTFGKGAAQVIDAGVNPLKSLHASRH